MSPISSFLYIFYLLLQCTIILAQPAASPAPTGPTNVTKILEKAGQFNTYIRLMKQTQVATQIDGQLNNSNSGLTVFAPTDSAFSALPAGTLNSLTDQQKVALVQFHVVPSFLSMPQFQTVSNPLRTQAGGTGYGEFPLNITTFSGNQVNVSTGVVTTTVSGTVYTDNQLAIYQVDKVLLPLSMFGPSVSAPAPSPAALKSKKKSSAADSPTAGNDVPADASGAVGLTMHYEMLACLVNAAVFASFWF